MPDTKTTKNHPLEVAKNKWKRIPHPVQRHAPDPEERVSYYTQGKINRKRSSKVKHEVKASATDKNRMMKNSRQTPK